MRRLVVLGLVIATRAEAAPDGEQNPVTVKSRLDGTTAMFDAHYVFHGVDPGVVYGFAEIAIPDSGVAIGGTVTVGGTRHPLALDSSTTLDDAFSRLATADPGARIASAVVIHLRHPFAVVDLALPNAGDVELDLTFAVPTCLLRDTRFAAVPSDWKLGSIDPLIREECGALETDPVWASFPTTELASAPDRVGVIGGRLVAGSMHVARVEIDLSRELAQTPKDLATAIVVDSSRSLTPRQVDVQREVVLAYLRLVPRSRVQVIATARTATALLPGWMPVESVLPRLDRELRGMSLRNGSNVDAGIALAELWLARVPGTHRIIVLTDGRLPSRLVANPPVARSLTHVVALDEAVVGLTRDDDGPLAGVAAASTGVVVRSGLRDIDATILVRPIALDAVSIAGEGWKLIDTSIGTCNVTVDAGHSCTWWGAGTAVSAPIVVEGLLWNRKISRIVQLDPRRATSLARELAVIRPFSDFAQTAVDKAAHALTDAWSLGARWGGTAGYGEIEGLRGNQISDVSTSNDGGTFVPATIRRPIIVKTDLRPQLGDAYARCHADNHRVVIDLETTRQEIVDVTVVVSPRIASAEAQAALDALHDCLVEAVWDTTLAVSDGLEHTDRHVALGP